MKAWDIIAYAYDGAIYCPECTPKDDTEEEQSPVFAESESNILGYTCGACGAWYSPDDGWTTTDPHSYRWARCRECNTQVPYQPSVYDRLKARQEKLECPNCIRGRLHF